MSNPANALPRSFWYAAAMIVVPTIAFVTAFLINPEGMLYRLVVYAMESYRGHP